MIHSHYKDSRINMIQYMIRIHIYFLIVNARQTLDQLLIWCKLNTTSLALLIKISRKKPMLSVLYGLNTQKKLYKRMKLPCVGFKLTCPNCDVSHWRDEFTYTALLQRSSSIILSSNIQLVWGYQKCKDLN